MVIRYLAKKAKDGWKLVDEAPNRLKLAYFIAGPAGVVIVPAYYGIKGVQAAIDYAGIKGKERERLRESKLQELTDHESFGDE